MNSTKLMIVEYYIVTILLCIVAGRMNLLGGIN